MSKEKLSELSIETLLKNEKSTKAMTYCLVGMLLVLIIINLFVLKKGFLGAAFPLALMPIVMINLGSLKEVKKELKSRGL
jgi:hypothetical protein